MFDVPLVDGAPELAHIIHRGDEKDPGPDMFLDLALDGYEVWQLQGADPARPYVLPIRRSSRRLRQPRRAAGVLGGG